MSISDGFNFALGRFLAGSAIFGLYLIAVGIVFLIWCFLNRKKRK